MQDNKLKQISKAIIVSIVVAILIIICIIGMIKTFWGSEIETVFILANKVSINIDSNKDNREENTRKLSRIWYTICNNRNTKNRCKFASIFW